MSRREYLIDHHPRCSRSRAALALLREDGIAPRVVACLGRPREKKRALP